MEDIDYIKGDNQVIFSLNVQHLLIYICIETTFNGWTKKLFLGCINRKNKNVLL